MPKLLLEEPPARARSGNCNGSKPMPEKSSRSAKSDATLVAISRSRFVTGAHLIRNDDSIKYRPIPTPNPQRCRSGCARRQAPVRWHIRDDGINLGLLCNRAGEEHT